VPKWIGGTHRGSVGVTDPTQILRKMANFTHAYARRDPDPWSHAERKGKKTIGPRWGKFGEPHRWGEEQRDLFPLKGHELQKETEKGEVKSLFPTPGSDYERVVCE